MGLARENKVRFLANSLALSVLISAAGQGVLADESSSSSSSDSSGSSSSSSSGSSSSITPLFGDSGSSGSSSSSTPSSAPSTGGSAPASAGGEMVKVYDKEFTPTNPLQGLFQMQPQYPTPGTTQMFPEAVSPNMGRDSGVQGRNPGSASHTYQQDFKDPYAPKTEDNSSKVNAINGLFQMQPQYPTPGTTQMFPDAVSKNSGNDSEVQGRNPGTASSTFQQPFKDPNATTEGPSKDQTNYLQGLFQQQPQYVSPNKTIEFPNAVQKNLGDDTHQSGRHPGQDGTPFGATQSHSGTQTITPGLPYDSSNGPGTATAQGFRKDLEEKGLFDDKTESLLDGKGLLKDSEPKLMTKDEKEALDKKEQAEKSGESGGEKKEEVAGGAEKKEEKEGEKKEGEKKEGEKKEETAEKKDEKDGEKKEEGEKKDEKTAAASTEKKGEEKKDVKADKKDGEKKEGDKDKKEGDAAKTAEKKDEKKEEVKYAPFNPLREAISLMNSNHVQESIDLLNKEIKKTAVNPQAFYTRAVAYVKLRKYAEAAADYNQVLKLAPNGAMANLAKAGLGKLKF